MKYFIFISVMIGSLLLYLLASASASADLFSRNYYGLLTLAGVLAASLTVLVGYQLWQLRGKLKAQVFGAKLTLKITGAIQEMHKGDRLIQASSGIANNYVPRAPEVKITARVISIYSGVSQAGQNAVITLNKGRRDGLENGHVLALYRKGEEVRDKGKLVSLPDVRYGLIFVFRTFDKVAYALVMQTRLPVYLLDNALTP